MSSPSMNKQAMARLPRHSLKTFYMDDYNWTSRLRPSHLEFAEDRKENSLISERIPLGWYMLAWLAKSQHRCGIARLQAPKVSLGKYGEARKFEVQDSKQACAAQTT